MSLAKALKKTKKPKRTEPVWKGPEIDGMTQSMLSRFLVCRERFRLLVVEGLRPAQQFNHRIEYGQMWHVCEEGLAETGLWEDLLRRYAEHLCETYPLQQEQIQKWYNVCKLQFPLYLDYWAKQKTEKKYTSVLTEQVFNVPYTLPSGRVVRLRGKWDGVSREGKSKRAGFWLDEHKTKGDLREEQITNQLQFDLQTLTYVVALQTYLGKPTQKICGVRFNCVRRPLSGGKGSIRPHKATTKNPAETMEHYYERLAEYIKDDPGYFFMRWTVVVTQADIDRFKREFLNPVLEQLCDWWKWIGVCRRDGFDPFEANPIHHHQASIHWRHPFGVYNVLNEGGVSELDEYLATGSELGLERTDKLFRELE